MKFNPVLLVVLLLALFLVYSRYSEGMTSLKNTLGEAYE